MTSNNPFRILIADDNCLNRRLLQELLKRRGYSVHAVNDGIEVIQALESESFDLLVLDCLMPGMDGFTVSRTIRSADRSRLNPAIPILALTALDSKEVRDKCLQAGMDYCIGKPFLAEALFRQVEDLLQHDSVVNSDQQGQCDDANAGKSSGAPGFQDLQRTASDVFRSMSTRVEADLVQWQAELETNLERNAFDDIRFLAHKIRGTADLLEWRELSKLSARLETVAESGCGPEVAVGVAHVVDSLGRCLKAVTAME